MDEYAYYLHRVRVLTYAAKIKKNAHISMPTPVCMRQSHQQRVDEVLSKAADAYGELTSYTTLLTRTDLSLVLTSPSKDLHNTHPHGTHTHTHTPA